MGYLNYHLESSVIRDIDPANDCLRYVADRFELNMEQRYWLAFLYSTCYCGPTVFYIYNEFPDYENVNVDRLERWWKSNKHKLIFQTDRLRIKTQNKFVETFQSYQHMLNGATQQEYMRRWLTPYNQHTYNQAYDGVTSVRNVGRFTAFIWLEMISVLTDFKCVPDRLDWAYADNCRKGLCYAFYGEDKVLPTEVMDKMMDWLGKAFTSQHCEHSNIYNIETTLCAYKKHVHGKRYVGYYIDRQLKELEKMEAMVTEGVCWSVLWDFRRETYKHLKHEREFFGDRGMRLGKDLGHEGIYKDQKTRAKR